jgi:hypothetical protein
LFVFVPQRLSRTRFSVHRRFANQTFPSNVRAGCLAVLLYPLRRLAGTWHLLLIHPASHSNFAVIRSLLIRPGPGPPGLCFLWRRLKPAGVGLASTKTRRLKPALHNTVLFTPLLGYLCVAISEAQNIVSRYVRRRRHEGNNP